jgi:hypothetical protein
LDIAYSRSFIAQEIAWLLLRDLACYSFDYVGNIVVWQFLIFESRALAGSFDNSFGFFSGLGGDQDLDANHRYVNL